MANPFISVSDLSSYIGRDMSADAGAVIAVDAASEICRDIAERDFTAGTTTLKLNGTGTDALLFPGRTLPVNTVTSVSVAGSAITDYTLNSNGDTLYRGTTTATDTSSVWPQGRQNVQVTFTHGYDSASLPRSVAMVALSIAARLVIQGPALEESVGNVRMRYANASTDLTTGEKMILKKYRRT